MWHYRKSVCLLQASVHLVEMFLDPAFKFKSVIKHNFRQNETIERKKSYLAVTLISLKETRPEIKLQHTLVFLKMQSDF